jgi:PAS domain S-box-containing protein
MKRPRHQEGFSSLLLQYPRVGVVVHAPDAAIILANEEAHRMLGLAPDRLKGKMPADLKLSFLREDGTVLPPDEYPVSRILGSGRPVRDLVVGFDRAATGDRVWALVSAFQENPSSERAGQVVVTFTDITEHRRAQPRESEARFRQARETGSEIGPLDYPVRRKDGKVSWGSSWRTRA